MEQAKASKQLTLVSSGKALPELNWIEWNIFEKEGLEWICKLGLDLICENVDFQNKDWTGFVKNEFVVKG